MTLNRMNSYQKMILIDRILCKKPVYICVSGNCMAPLIRDGTVIKIYRANTYELGDIVLVYVSSSLRVHRVVKKQGAIIVTKGDMAACVDQLLPNEQGKVLGKVSLTLSRDGNKIFAQMLAKLIAIISFCEHHYVQKEKLEKPSKNYMRLIKWCKHFEQSLYLTD